MNVLDLFSGIGGFSLGLERAGMRTVAFCEVNEYCRAVLRKHWPDVPCYDDVRTLTANRLAADGIVPNVICGGFPCQDISSAGRGAGIDGARSGLWAEYARLIGELRPRYVIVENVAALLGRGLDRVLGDLATLGYDAEWHCIPASAVGALHRRDRIWIVAYPQRIEGVERHQLDLQRRRSGQAEQVGLGGSGAVSDTDAGLHASGLERGGNRCAPVGSKGRDESEGQASYGERVRLEPGASSAPLADAERRRLQGGNVQLPRPATIVASAFSRYCRGSEFGEAWRTEPDVGRVAYGVPASMDRIGALGNAVVPEIPEIIGRGIIEADASI